MQNKLSDIKVRIIAAISVLIVLIAIGTIAYRHLEGWTFIQSFYFSVFTLTTVGYGDLHPTTEFSRLFTALYILLGVTVAMASIGIIGKSYLKKREIKILKKKKNSR